jgi:hypothetical protein
MGLAPCTFVIHSFWYLRYLTFRKRPSPPKSDLGHPKESPKELRNKLRLGNWEGGNPGERKPQGWAYRSVQQ